MLLNPSDEHDARGEDVQRVLEAAMTVGMDPVTMRRMSELIMETRVDPCSPVLAAKPTADAE